MIKYLPVVFLSVLHRIPWKKKKTLLTIALVPEIFKFEKWVKYANELTDDIIHSTQYSWFNEVAGDRPNLFVKWRVCYIKLPYNEFERKQPKFRYIEVIADDWFVTQVTSLEFYSGNLYDIQ